MSSDLISQLRAVALKLDRTEGCTDTLQSLIGQKKSKNKHYADINREAFLTPCIFVFIKFTCSHFKNEFLFQSRPHDQWSSDLGRWRNIWRWQKSGLNLQRLWLGPATVQPIQQPRPKLRHLRKKRLHLLQLQHRWIWWIAKSNHFEELRSQVGFPTCFVVIALYSLGGQQTKATCIKANAFNNCGEPMSEFRMFIDFFGVCQVVRV